jgi:monofunctional biosynthetic peptidoglycan transglycosylase
VLLLAFLAVAAVPVSADPAVAESPLQPLLEFAELEREPRWVAVNDGVMGGRSQGGPELRDGQLHFSGTLSLANNGGFSSVRSAGARYDLSGGKALVLRVKGDGRSYQLRLATGLRYRGIPISWSGSFDTTAGEWIEVSVPFDSLVPTVFGTELRGPPIDPAKVSELGFLIGDKREGEFALVVDWVKLR